ncbi:MAG: hypothetical protein ABR915_21005 [Thermoguttaceae bacterium]
MMTLYLRWACCILLCAATARGEQRQSGKSVHEPDFSELAKIAERYRLPLPPKDAPLVLGNTEWTTLIGSSSTSHDPGIYRPAFLLERLPQGKARLLIGSEERVVASDADFRPATRPYSLVAPKPTLKGYVLDCTNLSSFVTAVQLAQRGATDDAKALWDQLKAAEFFDDENALENVADLRTNPGVLLARCLYQHFYHATLAENADLNSFHEKLLLLQKEFPVLFSDAPSDFYPYRRSQFIRDLGLTAQATKAPEASVEALLIDWGNRTGEFRHLGFFNDYDVKADRPAREIFRRGIKAMPDLAKLVDDRRLTRHVSPAIMNAPEERMRLGELAKRLLSEMGGSQDVKTVNSLGNGEETERLFFERAAVSMKSAKIADFHDVPLWILGEKYPQALLAICSKVPAQATTDLELFALVDAIVRSRLGRQEKNDALAGLCQRLRDYRQQRYVLQRLARLDEPRCLALLHPILAKLPTDVSEPYWKCSAAYYTQVVTELHDDEIWKEYLKTVKRAAVGLRLQMLEYMTYSSTGDTNQERRLTFLAAFLGDTEVRVAGGGFFEGPCAAFTITEIEVRDYAAMQIASLLRFDDRPTEFWTKDEWARLRSKVQTALNKQGLSRGKR